jgi:hypothetical protein
LNGAMLFGRTREPDLDIDYAEESKVPAVRAGADRAVGDASCFGNNSLLGPGNYYA